MKHFIHSCPSFPTSDMSFPIVNKDCFNYLEERDHDYGWLMTKLPVIHCLPATNFPERMRSMRFAADSLQAISTLNAIFPTLLPWSMAQSLSLLLDENWHYLSIFQPAFCSSQIRCFVLHSWRRFFLPPRVSMNGKRGPKRSLMTLIADKFDPWSI